MLKKLDNGITLDGEWLWEASTLWAGRGYRISKAEVKQLLIDGPPSITVKCGSCPKEHEDTFGVQYAKDSIRIGCKEFKGDILRKIKKWAGLKSESNSPNHDPIAKIDGLARQFIKELDAAPDDQKQKVRDEWEKRFIAAGYGPLHWEGDRLVP